MVHAPQARQLNPSRPALLELHGVAKYYPGVTALDGIDLRLEAGEIHALLGENGAGKSTLVKIVSGVLQPDRGTRSLQGRGIALVPQDLWMVPGLSIGRNILLGMEAPLTRRRQLSRDELRRVGEVLGIAGLDVDPETPVAALNVSQLRLAQVGRALLTTADVIVLDEPTAVLAEPDAEHVIERLAALRDAGRGVLYVTHRLSEVARIADRITLLRDGRRIGHFARGEVREAELVALLTKGGDREAERPAATGASPQRARAATVRLDVESFGAAGRFRDVSLQARSGEVVGIAGVQGAGQSALLRAIAGLDTPDAGTVRVAGRALPAGDSLAAFQAGIRYAPADRRREGLVGKLSVADNLALTPRVRAACRRFGLRRFGAERAMALEHVRQLGIRPARVDVRTQNLSGGNQQKVVIGRVLESAPAVLLVEDPTQGVDVAAKREIHDSLRRLADERDCALIVASSDFEELLGLADVIHVMRMGRLVASLPGSQADYAAILAHALK